VVRKCFELTRSLHWSPVKQQIHYIVGLLGLKAKHSLVPPYLLELLSDYQPTRQLWSSSAFLFSKLAVASYFASHAFPTVVPSVWNSLEANLPSASSLVSFKSCLKTACSLPPINLVRSMVHCQAAPRCLRFP